MVSSTVFDEDWYVLRVYEESTVTSHYVKAQDTSVCISQDVLSYATITDDKFSVAYISTGLSRSFCGPIVGQWRVLLTVVPQADHLESSGSHHLECCHSPKEKDLAAYQTSNEILCPESDSHYFY